MKNSLNSLVLHLRGSKRHWQSWNLDNVPQSTLVDVTKTYPLFGLCILGYLSRSQLWSLRRWKPLECFGVILSRTGTPAAVVQDKNHMGVLVACLWHIMPHVLIVVLLRRLQVLQFFMSAVAKVQARFESTHRDVEVSLSIQ
jgi:hypothetical protein